MGVFFWDFKDYNDTWRQWICFVLNILVFAFTVSALFRSLKFHRKITLENVPLLFNLISTLLLLLLKLFEKGYEFDLIGYMIQIFTYFLFAFTFAIMLAKANGDHHSSKKIKVYIIVFIFIITLLVILIILVTIKVINRTCDGNLVVVSVLTLGFQILAYIPAIYNGRQLLNYLNQYKKSTLTETMLYSHVDHRNTLQDHFTIERKKQVFIVLAIYTFSLFIRVFLLIVSLFIDNTDLIECQMLQGIYIVTSDQVLGQAVLVLIEINQLLPHLIIPLAVFVVPMKSKTKRLYFETDQKSLSSLTKDDDDEVDSRDDYIKGKVSSTISERSDSPRRR